MARMYRNPPVPSDWGWYQDPWTRHEGRVARKPWGRIPVMSDGRAPVTDYHQGYRGYGEYVDPGVFKKPTNVGAIGVGIGVAGATLAAGLLATAISKAPSARQSIPAVVLPALGAGFVGYLLRWRLDKGCPPCVCRSTGGETVTGTLPERQGLI